MIKGECKHLAKIKPEFVSVSVPNGSNGVMQQMRSYSICAICDPPVQRILIKEE